MVGDGIPRFLVKLLQTTKEEHRSIPGAGGRGAGSIFEGETGSCLPNEMLHDREQMWYIDCENESYSWLAVACISSLRITYNLLEKSINSTCVIPAKDNDAI